jgi:hypothetical protein
LIAGPKPADRVADARARRYRRVADHANIECADQLAADIARLHAEGIDGGQQGARRVDELLAARGQAEAAAAALAQPVAEARFQRGELRADGRLADVERGLGRRDAAASTMARKTRISRRSRSVSWENIRQDTSLRINVKFILFVF